MVASGEELGLLYQALASPRGIAVEVSDFTLAQARLYKVRRESGDPELDNLSLRRPPDGTEGVLWIVRQESPPTEKEAEGNE